MCDEEHCQMLKETLTMLLIFPTRSPLVPTIWSAHFSSSDELTKWVRQRHRNVHFLVPWYRDFCFKRGDSTRGLGNGANEFCRAGATKVSTFVMASSTDDSELLRGRLSTPFTNAPSGGEVDRDGLAKFIF